MRQSVPRTHGWAVALALLAIGPLVLTGIVPSMAAHSAVQSTHSSAQHLGVSGNPAPSNLRHPPALGIGSASGHAPARPAASTLYYMQSGSTISELNQSPATGVARISEFIPIVTSPYSTGYELNGLSNTGDWWQIVVADNWPGCTTGFEEVIEVWDNLQNSGPVTCDSTVALSAGDLVQLTLYFNAGNGCLGLKDVTTGSSHDVCQAQPDTGGSKWTLLGIESDSNGYYTGTMTEVVNSTASSCPDYTSMPDVKFLFANHTYVTTYIPWSDEFDYLSGTQCYHSASGSQSIATNDAASHYVDTASGTSYGPRWVEGENYSLQDSRYGFRFETDMKRLTSVSLAGGPSTPTAGTVVNFTTTVAGGVSPYHTIWRLNGVIGGSANLTWSWQAGLAGTYHFDAYGVDSNGDAIGPSNTVVITVPGPLGISGIATTPTNGTDLGYPVAITARVSGGYGYWAFNWTGLPAGCAAANLSTIACTPSATGISNISVTVRDANGSQVSAGPHAFQVFPALTVQIASTTSQVDLGQSVTFTANVSGGSGGVTYIWSSFAGCLGRGVQIVCTPTSVGTQYVFVTVNDTVGAMQVSPGASLNVFAVLAATLSPSQLLADAGTIFSVRTTVQGGASPFGYQWTGLPAGCASTGPVANCSLPDAADYHVSVRVTDATGASASAAAVTVLGHATPSVVVATSASPIAPGGNVTFTATASGGSAPFSFRWSGLPDGCSAGRTATVACTPTLIGNYTVIVAATDQANQTVRASGSLSVAGTPGVPPSSSAAPLLSVGLELLLLVVAVAIVAALVGLWARRRQR